MPADEYTSVGGGGALRLKGGKVEKSKKKKKKDRKLERPVGDVATAAATSKDLDSTELRDGEEPVAGSRVKAEDTDRAEYKTEAERRHEEAARKKMLKMLEDPTLSSELRKTHKERVEGLNTYLSKLSEHHDMPKIGPG
ncbi:hypothetical protein GGR56DRAFT_668029 [Xylariaceae sp. FL0804]|nr:hypothetical protein GGR56DRAFT_668029 [Xylariaceae sp. FL0804]